ncbi:MAG: nucleotide exchange factor GrpE [Rhodospirillales bacterium]|nr:nucleotide exchange factor GrpE [Rhodospirillales bacterium]
MQKEKAEQLRASEDSAQEKEEISGETGATAPQGEVSKTDGDVETVDPLVELMGEIEILRGELEKAKDQALRAMAEAENTRRRAEREKGDALKYASLSLLRDLVKVADNMSRALNHSAGEEDKQSVGEKALREGVALTEKDLLSAFTRHGVTRIDPAGEPLNPERHEAMFEIPDDKADPGTILQVLEPGWMLHERLIRAARVGVAKKP